MKLRTLAIATLAVGTLHAGAASAQAVKLDGASTVYPIAEALNGESTLSCGDFTASDDDNVMVQGVQNDVRALAYFGYPSPSIEERIHELKEKVIILILTHNMQQAARVSDFNASMYRGELIEFGVTDELFIKPRDKRTEDYITGRFG
jgi:hypothetical protein